MTTDFSLNHFPLLAFARAGAQAQGHVPLATLARLAVESRPLAPDVPAPDVAYAVAGEMRTDAAGAYEPWLQLQASVSLRLVCQRCLGEVDCAVSLDRRFRFVASEALAEVEDEESEEDVLVASKDYDLGALIEDELLMAMPLVPMHGACPVPVRLAVADPDFEQSLPEKPNPFAVLEKLKR